MAKLETLTIAIDDTQVAKAAESMDGLTEAVERLIVELGNLQDIAHGGISIHVAGSLAECRIEPPAVPKRRRG